MNEPVLIGQAYYLRFDPKLWEAQQPYPPLGSLYAAACVRDAGYSVTFFDAMLAHSEQEWTAALERHRPAVAVIYEDSFNYLSKMCLLRMREAALTMIDAARARGTTVVVAGSDATDHPELYLRRGARAVIAGEGERTIVELLHALTRTPSNEMGAVGGLCFESASGHLVRTPAREITRDLDALPRPAWDLVDVEEYRRMWNARHGYFSMSIATTRGCPYHCNWCAKPIYGQRYTARSPEAVADEIVWLKTTYAPDHLWIADDIFGLKPGWIEQFARYAVERQALVPFKCLLRADNVTERVADALAAARCRTAWIGAESGSQKVLDAMEKGTRVDQIETAAHRLQQRGIEVGFFLQFGYPGETLEDIALTRAMVRRCRPDDIGISVSYPLPGTRFYDRVKAQLGAKQNWVDSSDLAMMYRATYVPEFYRALHLLVHAEFRALRAVGRRGVRPRTWREIAGGLLAAARVPRYRWRATRLARQPLDAPPTRVLAALTPQAAAIPSEHH